MPSQITEHTPLTAREQANWRRRALYGVSMRVFVQFDFVCRSSVSVQLLDRVRVVVQCHFVFGTDRPVQFLDRVLVFVYRLLAWGVDVVM